MIRLEAGGAVLGVFRDWEYEQGKVALASGDRVLLFTDGISEVTNREGEEFGEARLIEILRKSRELDAAELQQRIMRSATEFSGGKFQDDTTLIVVSVQ